MGTEETDMNWTWLGHSTFVLENEAGKRLVTDPVDEGSGYAFVPVSADVVTVSHGHHDHCAIERVLGDPVVIRTAGPHTAAGFSITGFSSFHDEERGAKRGPNVIYLIEADGEKIVHCGDLGHMPDDATLEAIRGADVLMIPVGGVYTVDGKTAWEITKRIAPKTVVPMHFKTPALRFRLDPVDGFLDAANADPANVTIDVPTR
jgi:L-ascorbate metabolism protein UlaG (beta-lactamase superfamily)